MEYNKERKNMVSEVFYRKWRPQTLAEVVGQEPITQTLLNALKSRRVSHAYLFCGPRGTGKTSTARILAKAVNCLTNGNDEPCNTCQMCQSIAEAKALDIIEIDAASNTGVDDIRTLRENVNYAPNQARYKVYIIDEVHMLSNSASNALLKTLEEPPPHVIFILATTEAHKILPTILSRCQRFDFRRLSQSDIISKLSHICDAEGIHIELESLRLITRSATGSLRDAENLLQQMTTYYGSEISLKQVQDTLGITGDWRAREMVKHIMDNDISAGITTINSVNSDGLDLRQFNRELVAYLRALLLIKTGSEATVDLTAEEKAELKNLAASSSLGQISRAARLFGQLEIGFDNYSTLPLELALVDCSLASEESRQSHAGETVSETRQTNKATSLTPAQGKAAQPAVKPKPESTSPVEEEPAAITNPPVDEAEPITDATNPAEERPPAPSIKEPVAAATVNSDKELGSEIERLLVHWKQVIEQAPQDIKKTATVAILRSAGVKPVTIENDTVCLAFRYPYHKEQIEKLENQKIAEKIISNFLGHQCHVRCILENNHLLKAALKMGAQIIDSEEK